LSIFAELKRRNVLAWLLIEVAGTLFPGFGIPDWAFRFVVILLALGFVPTLIFSWAYEIHHATHCQAPRQVDDRPDRRGAGDHRS
jgi:hypothetical protein